MNMIILAPCPLLSWWKGRIEFKGGNLIKSRVTQCWKDEVSFSLWRILLYVNIQAITTSILLFFTFNT